MKVQSVAKHAKGKIDYHNFPLFVSCLKIMHSTLVEWRQVVNVQRRHNSSKPNYAGRNHFKWIKYIVSKIKNWHQLMQSFNLFLKQGNPVFPIEPASTVILFFCSYVIVSTVLLFLISFYCSYDTVTVSTMFQLYYCFYKAFTASWKLLLFRRCFYTQHHCHLQ